MGRNGVLAKEQLGRETCGPGTHGDGPLVWCIAVNDEHNTAGRRSNRRSHGRCELPQSPDGRIHPECNLRNRGLIFRTGNVVGRVARAKSFLVIMTFEGAPSLALLGRGFSIVSYVHAYTDTHILRS